MKVLGGSLGARQRRTWYSAASIGLDLNDKDEVVTVKAVLPHGPADAAGVKAGDRHHRSFRTAPC